MTGEEFITLETAKLAKQAGFDWKVYTRYFRDKFQEEDVCMNYNNLDWFGRLSYSATTQSVLQRWLREIKRMCVTIQPLFDKVNGQFNVVVGFTPFIHRMDGEMIIVSLDSERTYESALEAGLQKCLTLLIEKL